MRSVALTVTVIALAILPAGGARAGSGLEGAWRGSGYVIPKDGAKQAVRVLATLHLLKTAPGRPASATAPMATARAGHRHCCEVIPDTQ